MAHIFPVINQRREIMKKLIIFSLIIPFLFIGCSNPTITKYDYKEKNGLVDKNVEIKQEINKSDGKFEINFTKKQLPLEINLNMSKSAYGGKIQITGILQKGRLNVKLITGDNITVKSFVFNACKIDIKTGQFDLYGGPHKLIFEFNDAENGKIKLNYQVLTM
jgi:hypothetical protein